MNRLTKSVLLVLIPILLATGAVRLWLDKAIQRAVEDIGSRVAQGSVSLNKVSVSLLASRVTLEGVSLGRSERFKRLAGLTLAQVQIQFDWSTLWSDLVVIEEIAVDRPSIVMIGALSPNDVDSISQKIETLAASGTKRKAALLAEPTESEVRKNVLVKQIVLTNGHIAGQAGDDQRFYPLPDLHLTEIGNQPGSLGVPDVASTILSAILD